MKNLGRWAAVSALVFAGSAICCYAQAAYKVDGSVLKGAHVKIDSMQPKSKNLNANKKGGITGIDSIQNFNGSFNTNGYGPNGAAQHEWYYNMVGQSPDGGMTTTFNSPLVPVSIELLAPDGTQGYYNGQPLYYDATQYVSGMVGSPIYQNSTYSSSKQPTQFVDAVMRAEFDHGGSDTWHTLLNPTVKNNYVMKVPYGYYYFAPNSDGSCCAFVLIDYNTFGNLLIPPSTPDSTTAVGNAEITGEITTKDISTFLFPNTYLYFGNPNNCCVLGFHTYDLEAGDSSNGNLQRRYVLNYSSWISPGLFGAGSQDVTALSHEMSETFNDPFVTSDGVHNVTPWWLSPNGNCQDNLEDGDVIEGLPDSTYPITLNGFTYHPQNEALLSWFAFEQNSRAMDKAYSYPDESTLTTLSPVEQPNCP